MSEYHTAAKKNPEGPEKPEWGSSPAISAMPGGFTENSGGFCTAHREWRLKCSRTADIAWKWSSPLL